MDPESLEKMLAEWGDGGDPEDGGVDPAIYRDALKTLQHATGRNGGGIIGTLKIDRQGRPYVELKNEPTGEEGGGMARYVTGDFIKTFKPYVTIPATTPDELMEYLIRWSRAKDAAEEMVVALGQASGFLAPGVGDDITVMLDAAKGSLMRINRRVEEVVKEGVKRGMWTHGEEV